MNVPKIDNLIFIFVERSAPNYGRHIFALQCVRVFGAGIVIVLRGTLVVALFQTQKYRRFNSGRSVSINNIPLSCVLSSRGGTGGIL